MYSAVPDWLRLPEGRTEIGSMHGTVAVSTAGEVYISVEGTVRQRFAVLGPNPGLQVYSPDGQYVRNVPNAPFDFHGFVIHKGPDGEFIYGTRLAASLTAADQTRAGLDQQVVVKMTLDGKIVMAIPASAIPDQFKNKSEDGRPVMRLTSIAVAPNGDIYATDGYSSDFIHRFDRTGKYIKSFGGKEAPYRLQDAAPARDRHAIYAGAPDCLRSREPARRPSVDDWRVTRRRRRRFALAGRRRRPRRLRGGRRAARTDRVARQEWRDRRHDRVEYRGGRDRQQPDGSREMEARHSERPSTASRSTSRAMSTCPSSACSDASTNTAGKRTAPGGSGHPARI